MQSAEYKIQNTNKNPDDSSSQRRQELAMGTACMEMQKQDDPADGVNRITQ